MKAMLLRLVPMAILNHCLFGRKQGYITRFMWRLFAFEKSHEKPSIVGDINPADLVLERASESEQTPSHHSSETSQSSQPFLRIR